MPQLPGYQIGNALIDFSGVNNALQNYSKNALAQDQLGMDKQRLEMDRQTHDLQKQNMARQWKREDIEMAGKSAYQIHLMPKGPMRDAAWNKWTFDHGRNGLTEAELNSETGPAMAAAAAGIGRDPLDAQLKNLQIQNVQSEIEARSKPQFTTIGHDAYGQPAYGFVNQRTMQVTPAPAQQHAAAGGAGANPSVTGDAYLATLPKPMAEQVKAIAEGRIPVPGAFALKTPYWQQMMTHVSQYDPTFDSVNYGSRSSTRKDFTSGASAKNITSFNTAIGHIKQLDENVDALGNTDYPMVNRGRNYLREQGGDTKFQAAKKNFETTKLAVVEELTRAFKGAAPDVTAVQEWSKAINDADSPAALHSAVRQVLSLLGSRINSLGEQYNRGMGTTKDPLDLLSPEAKHALEGLGGIAPAPVGTPGVTPGWSARKVD